MGQQYGLCAPSQTSSDALLKESFEYRQRRCNTFGWHTTVRARAKDVNDLTERVSAQNSGSAGCVKAQVKPKRSM
jgi:hypothetical protein